jgi:predicted enzyme related to lactoylglutathione lyase
MNYSREPGRIGWIDLTVANAEATRDFYARVAGWRFEPMQLEDRTDFTMFAADEVIGGICNAVGELAGLPAAWLLYINVPDLDAALQSVADNGGSLIAGPKGGAGAGRYAIVRDPGGAAVGLFEVESPTT